MLEFQQVFFFQISDVTYFSEALCFSLKYHWRFLKRLIRPWHTCKNTKILFHSHSECLRMCSLYMAESLPNSSQVTYFCLLGNFAWFLSSADFFLKINFLEKFFQDYILFTISLAISFVLHLYVLIFVQCRTISNAITRTES